MKRNKKAEGEILGILLIGCIIFGFMFAIGDNEYKSFMRDCEWNSENKAKFTYQINSTCYNNLKAQLENNVSNEYSCIKNKVDKVKLELYCQEKYIPKELKESDDVKNG